MTIKEKPKISVERARLIGELAYSICDAQTVRSPINLHQILDDEGLTFSYGDYGEEFDGLIEWKNRRFHVYANIARGNTEGSPRSRFTLAHELGHYFIDEHRKLIKQGRICLPLSGHETVTADLTVEQEANLFAACLLMPEREFISAAKRVPSELSGILTLAEKFGVSALCTAIRAVSLETSPYAISFWTEEGLRWKWTSWTWFAAGFRMMRSDFGELGSDFAITRALSDTPQKAKIHRNGGVAAFWFQAHKMGGYEDLSIIEEAYRLGQFGVLCLLRPATSIDTAKLSQLAKEHLGLR